MAENSRITAEPAALSGIPAEVSSVEAGTEIHRRVTQLMMFRLGLITLVLGATLTVGWYSDVDLSSASSIVLFGIIGTTYLLTIIYAVALRQGTSPERLIDPQMGLDLAVTAVLVHITGGAQSAYTFFFMMSIVGAATVRFRTGAIAVAGASVILFATISLFGWFELLPLPAGQRILPHDLAIPELVRALALNIAAMAGVAILAVNLGTQIQKTTTSLETQRSAAADLFTLYEDIIRSFSDGLLTVDLDGIVRTTNDAACLILGVPRDHLLGQHLSQVLPNEALTFEAPSEAHDLSHPRADEQVLLLGMSTAPLRNNHDAVIGRILTFQDLTSLRSMEEQVKRSERLATVGTLAAGIAHEIRNPLAAISGSVELLRHGYGAVEDNAQLMDIVTREIERLNGMISELLEYTNPQPPRRVRFDLCGLIEETTTVFREAPECGDFAIAFEAGAGTITLEGDPAKLRQVLWNLLRNAVQATGGNGHVVVRAQCDASHAHVDVEDDGPGIVTQNIGQIFDPFFTTKSRGSGLGLAICYAIIRDHGGSISVQNNAQRGCCFSISLPLQGADPVPVG